jgi:hypothetical protein
VRRRSRDVLVIGEERLLDDLDVDLVEEPQPIEGGSMAGVTGELPAPRDRVSAGIAPGEDEARQGRPTPRRATSTIAAEPQRRRAPAGVDGDLEWEEIGTGVRDAPLIPAGRRWGGLPCGAAASVAIVAMLATAATIALQSGRSGPSGADPQAERAEGKTRAPAATAGGGLEWHDRAARKPALGAREPRSGRPSTLSVGASTTPKITTAAVPAPAPPATRARTPTSAQPRDASRATVQREFGP